MVAVVRSEIRRCAPCRDDGGDYESEPQEEIAGYGCAGVDWFGADEDEDVGRVPDDGEGKGDEFPGEAPDVAVVGPVVVGVAVDVARGDDLVGQGPTDEADADEGEGNGEGAQDVFPKEFGVVGVEFLTGGTYGKHDWGIDKDTRLILFNLRGKDIFIIVGWKRWI